MPRDISLITLREAMLEGAQKYLAETTFGSGLSAKHGEEGRTTANVTI